MTAAPGFNKRLNPTEALDEGCVLVPFGFRVNGVSNPDEVVGDFIASIVRSEAGEFLGTLKSKPAKCFYGDANVSVLVDDTPMDCEVDWSQVTVDGTFTIRTFGPGTTALTGLTGTTLLDSNAITGENGLTGTTAGGPPGTCAITAGQLTITTLTGTCTLTDGTGTTARVEADPADDLLVGGFLLVKKTTRTRTG